MLSEQRLNQNHKCLPAAGLRVIDMSVGMSTALVVRMLADAGAHITCIAPPAGDPFHDIYPAYKHWKSSQASAQLTDLPHLASGADICLMGGEDFPGLEWRHDPEMLARMNSRLIVVHVGTLQGDTAVDLLVQARMGLINEQFSDRPICIAARTPTYGAALTAQLGLWAALIERESSGRGQIVRATMEQGAAMFWSQIWMDASQPSTDFDKLPPRDVLHLIFKCADQGWIQFVLGVPGALSTTYRVLNISVEVDPTDRGVPTLSRGPANYFADRPILGAAIGKWKRDELVTALRAAGIAAAPILRPGEAWSDPQVVHNGIIRQSVDGDCFIGSPVTLHGTTTKVPRANAGCQSTLSLGPLAGIRVVDLGNFIAGPFASKLLADLGADVIKVEPPTGLANLTGLRNTWSCNRGKRSIVVDMKSAAGMSVIRHLCAGADVVHYNFRVGVATRLGIDPPRLRDAQPDIVTLETSGYGLTGPNAREPAWDMVMQALCGLEMRAGGEGNAPLWYRSAIVDYATGALGAISILMALFHRLRTAQSVAADVSLLSCALFLMSEVVRTRDGPFVGAGLLNAQQTGFHPAEQMYPTKDGWIAVAARTQGAADNLAHALELTNLPPRDAWGPPEAVLIESRLRLLSTAQSLAVLKSAGVWTERCETDGWQRLRVNPEARRRNLVIDVTDRSFGTITGCFGPVVNFSRSEPRERTFRSAPWPGEHTREILNEIGLIADLDGLISSGAVS
jgi:crotonobetainyl-CoA:carnitine CoA-transferase CaiB-like acyl-CoA transferase